MGKPMCKRHESGREVMATDRISDLPDSLLHHILSFLPMKEAVATCLLSKRWRPLWLSLTNLDIDYCSFRKRDIFLQFVDAVLILGDLKPIKKFCLGCGYIKMPPIKINIWINAVINRKVEHLELHSTSSEFYISTPSHIFNCSTISILKLSAVIVNTPSSVNLPSLKVLHLGSVQLPNSKCLVNLILGCPLLEDLALRFCKIPSYNSTLDIERLENLFSAEIEDSPITLKAFSGVTVLRISWFNWSASYEIPTFYNLTRLQLRSYDHDWNPIMKCLQNCPKLEILIIDQFICRGQLMEGMLDVLECLSSHLKEFYLSGYHGCESQFKLVRFILKNAKVLRTISIHGPYDLGHKMFKRLSSCPKSSVNCRLLINKIPMSFLS